MTAGLPVFPRTVRNTGWYWIFSVAENLILQKFHTSEFSSHGILKRDKIESHARELIEKFDVRPSGCENRPAGTLSGGNQQKVIIAREITNNSEL